MNSILNKLFGVIGSALFPKVDPDYDYNIPERKILNEQDPEMHVQAVNQDLDKQNVRLGNKSLYYLGQSVRISKQRANPNMTFEDKIKLEKNDLRNEADIAESFLEENRSNVNLDQNTRDYNSAGAAAHMLFGGMKNSIFSSTNIFVNGTGLDTDTSDVYGDYYENENTGQQLQIKWE